MSSEDGDSDRISLKAPASSPEPGRRGWDITEERREAYRKMARASSEARAEALAGAGPEPIHAVNEPKLDVELLAPRRLNTGIRALSLFSGGGGLDLGFDLAGYDHVASYEILQAGADTIRSNRPEWDVHGGEEGDVRRAHWDQYRGRVEVIHAGPPCQPFSAAGHQEGQSDLRDMFPEFVRAVLAIEPLAFVAENVPALTNAKFQRYLNEVVLRPLSDLYSVVQFQLDAESFGIPQKRRRLFFVGIRKEGQTRNFQIPALTHARLSQPLPEHTAQPALFEEIEGDVAQTCMGAREALGLPAIGYDALAPTIRSTLTGPRHTTSVLSSASAAEAWRRLEIWPNGVARSRQRARMFVSKNGHFRLSVADCALLQGFPATWRFEGPVYMALGQIGNSVPPPMAYQVAKAIAVALT